MTISFIVFCNIWVSVTPSDNSFTISPHNFALLHSTLLSFYPASESEIHRIIFTSPPTSCSSDPVPTWLLKKHIDIILPFITLIVNKSFDDGVFPDSFKQAVVVPLLKKPNLDQEVLKNYRPISNLKFISKVLERVAANRLQEYLNHHGLTEPLQSAYKKHHSTETALVKVHNNILLALDSKKAVFLVLLDLTAAFDTIDCDFLADRFRERGIGGSAMSWISSYLNNRSQTVKVDNSLSSVSELKYGVPQGSVLGPSFFSVYAAPLADIARSHNIDVHLYADDTQLYTSFNPADPDSEVHARTRMEACIAEMKTWMICNKLQLNDDKSEFLIIASRHQMSKIQCHSLHIGNSVINAKPSVRNLGVQFDSEMSMSAHVNLTCRNLFFQIRNINSVRKSMSEKVTASIIHSYILSRLDYGNALLINANSDQIVKLQRVQNAAARILSKTSKFTHITPVLKQLHWLPVVERIKFKILLLTWKIINGLAPHYFDDLISEYVPSRSLRSSGTGMLTPRRVKCSFGEKAFATCAPVLWNALPSNVRNAKSLESFKSGLKTHLFSSYFN